MAIINGTSGSDSLSGTTASDVLSGGAGADVLLGLAGDDVINGGSGDDRLDGGEGDDVLTGGQGADTLEGGAGNDVAVFEGNYDDYQIQQGQVVDANGQTVTAYFVSLGSIGGETDLLIRVESIQFADRTLSLTAGEPFAPSQRGGDGPDRLVGTVGYDLLVGGAGADTLIGGAGADTLHGYLTNSGRSGVPVDGDDHLDGGPGPDVLRGNDGADTLLGGEGADNLRGDAGDDVIDGGPGTDSVAYRFDETTRTVGVVFDASGLVGEETRTVEDGLGGRDRVSRVEAAILTGTSFADTMTGTSGRDQLSGAVSPVAAGTVAGLAGDVLRGLGGDDVVAGSSGADALFGDSGNDRLRGYASDDTLDGGEGNDTLIGDGGRDVFEGGVGQDVAAFDGVVSDYLVVTRFQLQPDESVRVLRRVIHKTNADDVDVLFDVEEAQFQDVTLNWGAEFNVPVHGSSGNDVIGGTSSGDVLSGGLGADTLHGLEGADVLAGGSGGDELRGGPGQDIAVFDGRYDDYVITTVSAVGFDGGTSTAFRIYRDTRAGAFDLLVEVETVHFSDRVLDLSTSTIFASLLRGTTGPDSMTGTDLYDNLAGGAGADTLMGGSGGDTLFGYLSGSGVPGTPADGPDYIDGGPGADVLRGNDGADTLLGGEGWDNLRGDAGDDVLDGGPGIDLVSYRFDELGLAAGVRFDASGVIGEATRLVDDGQGGRDRVSGIEFVLLVGTVHADTLTGSAGNDQLDGEISTTAEGLARRQPGDWVEGGAGDDLVRGGPGDDTLMGGADADRLAGFAGDDILDGGSGQDVAFLSGNFDDWWIRWVSGSVAEGSARWMAQRVSTRERESLISIETLTFYDRTVDVSALFAPAATAQASTSTEGADTIDGSSGYDDLAGGGGADILRGGSGADTLRGDGGSDSIDGGAGVDTAAYRFDSLVRVRGVFFDASGLGTSGSAQLSDGLGGTDTLTGIERVFVVGTGLADVIFGSAGDDHLMGDAAEVAGGADLLSGGAGDDLLMGGAGADSLVGGAGQDELEGGAGLDLALYNSAERSAYQIMRLTDGRVRVVGPEGEDTLSGVERLVFQDKAVALDVDGIGGKTYRLYKAAFDRVPDAAGVGFWMHYLDSGFDMLSAASNFMDSAEFRNLYDNDPQQPGYQPPSPERFVTLLYRHVLQRPAEGEGYQFWVDAMVNRDGRFGRTFSPAEVLVAFAESAENRVNVVGVIGNGFDYMPFVPPGG